MSKPLTCGYCTRTFSKEYCKRHPDGIIKPPAYLSKPSVITEDVLERLIDGIEVDENDCWVWTKAKCHGYGHMYAGSSQSRMRVHRIMYAIFVDDLDPDLVIDHLCCNTACCNPEHLEQVTQVVNAQRNWARLKQETI